MRDFSIHDFVRTNIYTAANVDYSRVAQQMTINIKKSIRWFGRDFKRAVKRQISKNSSGKAVQKVRALLRTPKGMIISQTPTEFMQGKRSVASGRGRGGRKRVEPRDELEYRWNKVNSPGGKPRSHPANQPGWQNHWLYNAVLDAIDGTTVTVFVNPAPPGKRTAKSGALGRLYPRTLEFGGTYSWSRKIPQGYFIETVSTGVITQRGNARTLDRKKGSGRKVFRPELNGGKGRWVWADDMQNKSGTTRREHYRKWAQPRVVLRYDWRTIGKTGARMEPRPFMQPAIEKFLPKYLNSISDSVLKAS
ncbi:MAG: hypothetical protein Q4D38_11655 [Planctomycetia bacterium]|nr:hypothetical protein [Planctomycetia bacterium]